MKDINTLSSDIYHLFDSSEEHDYSAELAADYAMRIGGEFAKATQKRDKPREKGSLWASDLGKRCMRQHYYNFNAPDKAEPLLGHTKFKFLYGNILEEAVLYFAEEAGHTVSNQQERLEKVFDNGWTVSGRIDAVIDGKLVDVKTASTYSFNKYMKEGVTYANDTFGYLYQLGFYQAHAPLDCDGTGFLFIDKQNGHITYTDVSSEVPTPDEIDARVSDIAESVQGDEHHVPRGYTLEPYGKSGNMALGVECSYCPFKAHCWRDSNGGRGLRGFAYNHKPVWFADVAREPKVPEITGD